MIKTLSVRNDMILHPTAPFNFDGTVHKPSHFPSSDTKFEQGRYWQSLRFDDTIFGIRLVDNGTIDAPEVTLSIFSEHDVSPAQLNRVATEIEYRFDLKADILKFYQDCGNDELLVPAIARWRGMRVCTNTSLYEFLVITTVLQNATVRRSVQMLESLFSKYGSKVAFDEKELSVFWSPVEIVEASEDELRVLKVGYRAKTLKKQAEVFASCGMDELYLRVLPKPDLKNQLLSLYGVGPASVWYLLFEVFKQYDVFEYISPWEQRIYSRILFNQDLVDTSVILDEVNARWGKWKMLAAHYVFEDLFWQRKNQSVPWLDELIRL